MILRFADAEGVEVAVDAGLYRRRRRFLRDRLELGARARVVAGVEIGAGELEASARVVGIAQHVALEREHADAGAADVDRRDPAPEVRARIGVDVDRRAARVGARRVAGFDQRPHVVGGGRLRRRRSPNGEHRDCERVGIAAQ